MIGGSGIGICYGTRYLVMYVKNIPCLLRKTEYFNCDPDKTLLYLDFN
jgi:hypothetical protein